MAGWWRSTGRSTAATAGLVAKHFIECVAAPEFTPEAVTTFEHRKNLRAVRSRRKTSGLRSALDPPRRKMGSGAA
jgi:AICAR transformylase/IMP cyclohydrolase PurH